MSNCGGCEEITLPLGQDGVDGENAFTITTSSFNQPAYGSPVSIQVSNLGQYGNAWASAGQVVYIADSSGNGGWYSIVSTTGTTTIEINNLGYPGSSAAGQAIGTNAKVSPSGLQGPAGAAGAAGTNGTNGSQGTAGINGTTLLRSAKGNSTTSNGYVLVSPTFSWTLGTDLLSQNNDKIVIEAVFNNNKGSGAGLNGYFKVLMYDGVENNISRFLINNVSPTDLVSFPGTTSTVKVEVLRVTINTVRVSATYIDSTGNVRSWGQNGSTTYSINLSGAVTIYINGKISGTVASGEFIECVSCSVSSYKQ